MKTRNGLQTANDLQTAYIAGQITLKQYLRLLGDVMQPRPRFYPQRNLVDEVAEVAVGHILD